MLKPLILCPTNFHLSREYLFSKHFNVYDNDVYFSSHIFFLHSFREWLKMLISLDASLDILFDLPPPHPLLFGEQVTFQRMNYFTRCDGPLITPLIFAICSYNINLVRFLLKNGASPNFADEKGLTPIMHAVKKVNFFFCRF